MAKRDRRHFLAMSASTVAAAASVSAFKPDDQATPAGTDAASKLAEWSGALGGQLKGMPKDKLDSILKANGLSDADELLLTLSKRYPTIKPDEAMSKVPQIKFVLENGCPDGPSYEKSPGHDKEPYDKGRGYDRTGFSKT